MSKLEPFSAAELNGLVFSEAFHRFVVDDSEIIDHGKKVIAENRAYRDVFEEGRFPGPVVNYRWPINVNAVELAWEFVRSPVRFIPGPPEVPPSDSIRAACAVIVDRWSRLISLLREGSILCAGLYCRTGVHGTLNKTQWSRSGVSIDVRNGDFFDEGKLVWQDLTFSLPKIARTRKVRRKPRTDRVVQTLRQLGLEDGPGHLTLKEIADKLFKQWELEGNPGDSSVDAVVKIVAAFYAQSS
jgi:hypothetical protein